MLYITQFFVKYIRILSFLVSYSYMCSILLLLANARLTGMFQ